MSDIQEVTRYHKDLLEEVKTIQISDEEGGWQEQIFTRVAVDLMAEAGETENVRIAYDEKVLKSGIQHKINGYALSDNYETLDLFISIFHGQQDIERIAKDEVDKASKRISNFFKNAIYKDYVNEIEESSEIFDLAHTLNTSTDIKNTLVRVNAIILSDGIYPGEIPKSQTISGYPIFYRIIDLNYLYNISEKSHIPIEIDFKGDGFKIPCIQTPGLNDEYQSYLAIISGEALANIYERFGARLLEQNVRSFLQFSGKINKGIRTTIIKEPDMFLAFNNGIAATADSVELIADKDSGLVISKINDLQIVNGGQTTASIYHSWKKDKADISKIFVQVKLSVVKNKEKFSEIVGRIAEYANTQNKVSASDLSSNRPFHIFLEKLSRTIWAPPLEGNTLQTRWFFERARGQYKNSRLKEGTTPSRQKAFDLKNPKNQVFSKEDLAKYINAYKEAYDSKKLTIGPHTVVRGNQKNYIEFVKFRVDKVDHPDSVFFEDSIAKMILFKTAEKLYGVKPNSIGDMRYITVPYTLSWFNLKTENKLDLYKIWKTQMIPEVFKNELYELMIQIETFIKKNAPGSLYGEWAKKEDCWNILKSQEFEINEKSLDNYMGVSQKRISLNEVDLDEEEIRQQNEVIYSLPNTVFRKIDQWGLESKLLSINQRNIVLNISDKVRLKKEITTIERGTIINIINLLISKDPEFLEFDESEINNVPEEIVHEEITPEIIKQILDWDRKNKRMKPLNYKYMHDVFTEQIPLGEQAKKYCRNNLIFVKKWGFKPV
ncbi:MAG: AIPR family protein [Opitutaceae bacterium]|nr:AIPR family protein [Cytophagales bacterium]